MPWYCAVCFSYAYLRRLSPAFALCSACRDELEELRLHGAPRAYGGPPLLDITALFRYQGLIRRLILRAKVSGDHRALLLLTTLALGHPTLSSLLTWADGLMPSPSSLWGRLRGRLDIAAQLCAKAARPKHQLYSAPLHLHWRWRKNARLARDQRSERQDPAWLRFVTAQIKAHAGARTHQALTRRSSQHLLLVDDVVTSGETFRRTATALAEQQGSLPLVRGLALAST